MILLLYQFICTHISQVCFFTTHGSPCMLEIDCFIIDKVGFDVSVADKLIQHNFADKNFPFPSTEALTLRKLAQEPLPSTISVLQLSCIWWNLRWIFERNSFSKHHWQTSNETSLILWLVLHFNAFIEIHFQQVFLCLFGIPLKPFYTCCILGSLCKDGFHNRTSMSFYDFFIYKRLIITVCTRLGNSFLVLVPFHLMSRLQRVFVHDRIHLEEACLCLMA